MLSPGDMCTIDDDQGKRVWIFLGETDFQDGSTELAVVFTRALPAPRVRHVPLAMLHPYPLTEDVGE